CNANSEVKTGRDHKRYVNGLEVAQRPTVYNGWADDARVDNAFDWECGLGQARGLACAGENASGTNTYSDMQVSMSKARKWSVPFFGWVRASYAYGSYNYSTHTCGTQSPATICQYQTELGAPW